ncbi:MAG: hypothetical protein QM522_02470 [Chitinophagaceae bacterium]|nr:hypothetical protein [Chitinophagaceae bacterium]
MPPRWIVSSPSCRSRSLLASTPGVAASSRSSSWVAWLSDTVIIRRTAASGSRPASTCSSTG